MSLSLLIFFSIIEFTLFPIFKYPSSLIPVINVLKPGSNDIKLCSLLGILILFSVTGINNVYSSNILEFKVA